MGKAILASDDALIDDSLAGNAAAFGELVRKYQDRLFHSIYHASGGHAEAEDVVQDAFVQAFLKLKSFQRQSAFYTWLYRIAMNIWISRRRRQKPVASLDKHLETSGFEPVSSGEDVMHGLNRNDEIDMLQAAMHELDDERRQIIVLREIDELSYEEIADMTKLPIGTVRSRLHRARQQLVEIMKRNNPELFVVRE
jgi:RNA polymerase sigma-70 factor (ECF subfamily)